MTVNISPFYLTVALLFGLFSSSAGAFSVWAVDSGADSSTNSPGNVLMVLPGTSSIDLYFDTEGDISWGWDILLDVTGVGTVSGVTGGDNLGFGVSQPDGGWQQQGGDPFTDLISSSTLMFSFDFDAESGAVISIGDGSIYTSGGIFDSVAITAGDLVSVSAIPLPAAAWLFLSGMGVLGFTARKRVSGS